MIQGLHYYDNYDDFYYLYKKINTWKKLIKYKLFLISKH